MNDAGLYPGPAGAPDLTDEPYPGLRSFRRFETHIFFGREDTTNDMVNRLREHRFLAVTGGSGSGKSSLVRTGLLDALDRGLLTEAGADWRVADFRPGTQPLDALTDALLEAVGGNYTPDERAIVRACLGRGPLGLVEWLDEVGLPDGANLLLLVDQFEETFRFHQSDEADAFVALLLTSMQQRRWRVYVVITMRSDFLGECARFPGFAEAVNDSQFLTPRLTRGETTRAIEGPANVYGGSAESTLVTRLLNDMGSNPDQLPLMQHMLMLMWQRAAEHTPDTPVVLTLSDYESLGGITGDAAPMPEVGEVRRTNGALSDHVDRVLLTLSATEQRLAQVLFRALVDSEGTIGRDVRRPTSLTELAGIAEVTPEALIPVIEAFRQPGRNFLTPACPMSLKPDTTIDISHESLIRQWRTLRGWVREEFQSAETYSHIETSARLWQQGQSGRLGMPYLGLALAWRDREHPNAAWAARYGGDFPLAMRYLESSRRLKQWRTNVTATVVALSLLGTGGFGIVQFVAVQHSKDQLDQANGRIQQLEDSLTNVPSKQQASARGDELEDFHVAPQNTLKAAVGTKTPIAIPGGHIVLTRDLGELMRHKPSPLLIDVWNDTSNDHRETILAAIRIPFAGQPGDFKDSTQARLTIRLANLTGDDKQRYLVFFCLGKECWESYNAVLRAVAAGYKNVYWYRGGLAYWRASHRGFIDVDEEANDLEVKIQAETKALPEQIWADAITLSESVDIMLASEAPNLSAAAVAAELSFHEMRAVAPGLMGRKNFQVDLLASEDRDIDVLVRQKHNDLAVAELSDMAKARAAMVARAPDDPELRGTFASALYRLAHFQVQHSAYAEGVADYQAAIGAWQWMLDHDTSGTDLRATMSLLQRALADTYAHANQPQKELAADQAALQTDTDRQKRAPGNASALLDRVVDLKRIGDVHVKLHDQETGLATYSEAVKLLSDAGEQWQNSSNLESRVADAQFGLSKALAGHHDLVDALQAGKAALAAATHVIADKPRDNAARDSYYNVVQSLGDLAWRFDLSGDYVHALEAADAALSATPYEHWIEMNRAHALMFLGRTDDARAIYTRYMGQTYDGYTWNPNLRNDFADLRKAGHEAPLMAEIEKALGPAK